MEASDLIKPPENQPCEEGVVHIRVEEIIGEPGDVFLMHPHALHGLSDNVLETPRLALTQTIYPKAWKGAY